MNGLILLGYFGEQKMGKWAKHEGKWKQPPDVNPHRRFVTNVIIPKIIFSTCFSWKRGECTD